MAFQTRLSGPLRLLIAVSKSENPQEGWWTYADAVGTNEINAQDYMWMGINFSHLLISNQMSKCTGTYPSPWNCNFVRTRHLMYTAADLVQGKPYSRTEWAHAAGNNAVPCVHNSFTTDSFWVRREDATHVRVFGVRKGEVRTKRVEIKSSPNPVNGTQKDGSLVAYNKIGKDPQNAEYRDGKIVFVSNDGQKWDGQSTTNNCVRLVRLNVSKFFKKLLPILLVKVEIDRPFGFNNMADPAGSVFDYRWPAVATNAKGDIVIGSIRSNPTIYPELRGSVWFAGESDLSPSVSLQTSSSALTDFHMAGACADPSSDAVYLAQQYGYSSPARRVHVAKMLG